MAGTTSFHRGATGASAWLHGGHVAGRPGRRTSRSRR
ncbi:unnamed protein product [Linum tenue]|uniref:Uncharacterized protein n=1 Tax=Linum tenue TaxID=586396 RepID=A0AAV0PQY0_9ROSI|nr:unnamed protein product [Linum tenue]